MAKIYPFAAWRYASDHIPVSSVVTQPYDKITSQMQERYYQANPYNLVRIILGKRCNSDNASENVYSRAAANFGDWRRRGVLRQDPKPSLYRYTQSFMIPGSNSSAERSGFIALGQLEDYSASVVFRHEQTLAKPKVDRLELLRATHAHFGQIFMLYSGSGSVSTLLHTNAAPDIEVTDEYGVLHRVFRISDPELIQSVQSAMDGKKLIIADGHHRYETALAYRNEKRKKGDGGCQVPWNSAMMTFVDMDSPGLVILPTHRVISGQPAFLPDKLKEKALEFFKIEEPDSDIDAARASEILRRAGQAGTAVLAVTADRVFLLHSPKATSRELLTEFSERQRVLDVVQLHACVLERALGISGEAIRNEQGIAYQRDAAEAMAQVRGGRAQVAFLMNPVRIQQVRDIALSGEVLPQKSTDFYPKLLSGLTIYALD
jgi:uncharacterized protein (DUF1015 family)